MKGGEKTLCEEKGYLVLPQFALLLSLYQPSSRTDPEQEGKEGGIKKSNGCNGGEGKERESSSHASLCLSDRMHLRATPAKGEGE